MDAAERLREAGLRVTVPRVAVFEAVVAMRHADADADRADQAVPGRQPHRPAVPQGVPGRLGGGGHGGLTRPRPG